MRYLIVTGILVALLLHGGCSRQVTGPHLLLVTIDTLRPDFLACYGNPDVRTPVLDRIAREGTQVARAYVPVPATLPSHATILTGLPPDVHGVHENGIYRLAEDRRTIAEYLSEAGYATGAIVASFQLAGKYGLSQGFEQYDDDFPKGIPLYNSRIAQGPRGDHFQSSAEERRADIVTDRAISWIEKRDERPFFLWVHYFDPHMIYDPPPPFDALYNEFKYPNRSYAGEITYLDRQLGRLREQLEEEGLWKNTFVVVVADHGEGLGEHGEVYHDQFLYDSTLRVPLLFGGGWIPSGWPRVIDAGVVSESILPTILDVLGLRGGQDLWAESVCRFWHESEDEHSVDQYIQNFSPVYDQCAPLFAIRSDRWKYVEAPVPELYDLRTDPGERVNRAEDFPDRASALRHELQERIPDFDPQRGDVDAETRRRLEAIGYLTRGSAGGETDWASGADPKEMAPCIEGVHLAMMFYTRGEPDSGLQILLPLRQQFPGRHRLYNTIALLRTELGQFDELIRECLEFLEIDPTYANGALDIGITYMRRMEDEAAIKWLRKAIEINPRLQLAHYNLGAVLARNGWLDEALVRFRAAVRLDPRNDIGEDAQQGVALVEQAIRSEAH